MREIRSELPAAVHMAGVQDCASISPIGSFTVCLRAESVQGETRISVFTVLVVENCCMCLRMCVSVSDLPASNEPPHLGRCSNWPVYVNRTSLRELFDSPQTSHTHTQYKHHSHHCRERDTWQRKVLRALSYLIRSLHLFPSFYSRPNLALFHSHPV